MSTKDRKIHYLSKIHIGKEHDYAILKAEFPSAKRWFADKIVRLDLGFQGFQDRYKTLKTYLPYKRKRVKKGEDNALSEPQKQENKTQAQARVCVEHSIGGMKRFRIIHHQVRIKLMYKLDMILGVCAGLWNFLIC